MGIVVQKYGGSSVSDAVKIKQVASKIVTTRQQGHDVVVVVSAMGKSTDQLVGLAREVSTNPAARELDMLLSSGERISMALLSMAIQQLGHDAISLTGSQCRIITDGAHCNARIAEIRPTRILEELARGRIVVVAGFQGINDADEVTTLGRGGSDTSAVALAAALGAEHCDIFSDVDGVYTADPRIVQSARRLEALCYEEMQELSRHGARVLNAEAVEFARRNDIAIYARSTFGGNESTVIREYDEGSQPVSGVTGRTDLLHLSWKNNEPPARDVVEALDGFDIVGHKQTPEELEVLLSTENAASADVLLGRMPFELRMRWHIEHELGSVAAVGRGIGANDGLRHRACHALASAGIPIRTSFTSPDSIACVVPTDCVPSGIEQVHRALIDAA